MMKKLIFTSVLIGSVSFAINYEYPYIYKEPRVMGMGGAYVAVGGTSASLFYNPAGIGKIKKEAGFEVDLIGLTASISRDGYNFIEDFQDALNADDQLTAVNDVLKKYRGKNLHFSLSTFPSIARRFEKLSFALGGIMNFKFDAIPHQGFGSEGLLSVDTSLTYGSIGGISYSFMKNRFILGVSIKHLRRELISKDFTARELVENQDNIESYITDQLIRSGSATSFDIGVIYDLPDFIEFKPSLGASYMNVNNLDFGEAGTIPGTLNVGFALKKERTNVKFFKQFIFAFDVVDITQNYEQDRDFGKRLRAGMEFSVWSGKLSDFFLRFGSYQGYWTAGAELRLLLLRIVATTYGEEIGAYSGQDENRRYMLSAYVTW